MAESGCKAEALFIELHFEQTDASNKKIGCKVRRAYGFYSNVPLNTIHLWTGVFDT